MVTLSFFHFLFPDASDCVPEGASAFRLKQEGGIGSVYIETAQTSIIGGRTEVEYVGEVPVRGKCAVTVAVAHSVCGEAGDIEPSGRVIPPDYPGIEAGSLEL